MLVQNSKGKIFHQITSFLACIAVVQKGGEACVSLNSPPSPASSCMPTTKVKSFLTSSIELSAFDVVNLAEMEAQ